MSRTAAPNLLWSNRHVLLLTFFPSRSRGYLRDRIDWFSTVTGPLKGAHNFQNFDWIAQKKNYLLQNEDLFIYFGG